MSLAGAVATLLLHSVFFAAAMWGGAGTFRLPDRPDAVGAGANAGNRDGYTSERRMTVRLLSEGADAPELPTPAALDAGGFLGPVGPFADGANALISAARGNWTEAGTNLVAIVPLLGDGVKGAKMAARGGATAVRIGQAGEAAVRAAYDIGPKATRVINGRTRIFDGLTDDAVSEVKNVGNLSFTQQIRDTLSYAQANGLRFDLYIRGGANPTQLSGPLADAIRQGLINPRFIP